TPQYRNHAADLHDLPSRSILRILWRRPLRNRLPNRVPFSLALQPRPRNWARAVADPGSRPSRNGLSDLPRSALGRPYRGQPPPDRGCAQSSTGDELETTRWRAQKVQHEWRSIVTRALRNAPVEALKTMFFELG